MSKIMGLNEIAKSGAYAAKDAELSGTLTPEQGRVFAKSIVAANVLLSKVTTDITGKLTKERSGWDTAKGILTRHKSGTKAPDENLKKLGKIGCKLNMTNAVELNAKILDETLEDNKKNKDFEKEQFAAFNTIFSNDLEYLGIIGEDDNDAIDAEFKDLGKGWFKVADEHADTIKITSSNSSILERLKYIVKNANKTSRKMSTILMSDDDYTEYQFEISQKYRDLATLLKASTDSFMQLPIERSPDIPNDHYLLTPLKNLIFGISSTVKRQRWWDNDESALKYKFVVFPDYEIDVKKFVTYLKIVPLEITSYETTVKVGATSTKTVQNAAGAGIEGVTVMSKDTDVATVEYASGSGTISIRGVVTGSTSVEVSDGTSVKTITVTVELA